MPATPFVETEIPATEAVVQVLREAGVSTVFGISGGDTGRIFSRLAHHTEAIRTVLVRSESSATAAAEAYARLSGRIGVAMGQGAWLIGQGMVGILEAFATGTPLLLLADLTDGRPFSHHAPYQAGTGHYGAWDAVETFRGVTKRVFVATNPVEAVQSVQLGIKHAGCGQPGPVAVLFGSASVAGTVGPASVPRLYSTAHYLSGRPEPKPDMTDVAEMLAEAAAPVIIAGGGVRLARAGALLREIATRTGAAVVTTPSGKGTFPEDHPNSAGVFGTYGSPVANELLAHADVVLVLGSKLGPTDTANETPALLDPVRQRIVQVDVEPLNAAWTTPTSDVVVSDVAVALEALRSALDDRPIAPEVSAARLRTVDAARRSGEGDPSSVARSRPIHPRRAIAELRKALPDDAIVCTDAGENRLFMSRFFQTRLGGDYLQPAGAGGMGYSIPAAIGAKAYAPERVVVAVCGDGGFSMALPSLFTAVEENLPIIVVVFDNGALGWVRHSQRVRGELEFSSTLHHFDYAAIGEAVGYAAFRVDDANELGRAFAAARASGGPAIVVVSVSTEETFADLRTPLMAGMRR